MPKTKICTNCNQRKPMEMFGNSKNGKDGHKSKCKMCESKYAAARYAAKVGKPVKAKRVLISWQPQPGEKFDAYLGRNWCVLNPFVCVRNDVTAVICTGEGKSWKLPKSEYIFCLNGERT